MRPKINSKQMEVALALYFDYATNIVVPNIREGLGLRYEADLVVLRPSGWAEEVEIKISKSDLRADKRKKFLHDSSLFRQLWFALPKRLCDDTSDVPENAGVLSVEILQEPLPYIYPPRYSKVDIIRPAKIRENAQKFTEAQQFKLLRLCHMRVWSLKRNLVKPEDVEHD